MRLICEVELYSLGATEEPLHQQDSSHLLREILSRKCCQRCLKKRRLSQRLLSAKMRWHF